MTITYGGGTGTLTQATTGTIQPSGGALLAAGWWLPTTLTATRALYGYSTAGGAEIDTVTSELRVRSRHATTDGVWTTTGVGLTVNQWKFVAVLESASNTGPTVAWRVWVASDAMTPPVEVPLTLVTTPVGNMSTGNILFAGNNGGAASSFQGDIGWLALLASVNSGLTNMFNLATSGVISADEAEFILQRFVIPLWKGTPEPRFAHVHSSGESLINHFPMHGFTGASSGTQANISRIIRTTGAASTSTTTGTNNPLMALSNNEPPTRMPAYWPVLPPLRRR